MKIKSLVSHPLFLLVLTAALVGSQPGFAQTTSSSLRGSVTDAGGAGIPGATVEIVHVPSGTVSRATASATGQFFQAGLRVGGPYEIRVSSEGYRGTTVQDVFLDPGAQNPVRVTLEATAPDFDTIVVVGARVQEAVELNSGVGSSYTASDIANQPAINRDVIQTLVRDPLAHSSGVGNLSVAGVNPRFNGLAIDGSLQQDDFGLGSNTYATSRSPINLDAIESASLVASDYSVTATGFTGGLVNIVTRSGSNDWRGNVYYAMKNDSMIGKRFGDRRFDPGDVDEKEYGFTLSGPIIKDRLFFFVSYDEYESGRPFDFNNADQTNGREPGYFEALRNVIDDTYGHDPLGRPLSGNIPITSERILAKVDWNITQDHRLSFTYQSTEEGDTNIDGANFESTWYDIPVDLEAYTLQLFSDWSYNFSTDFRINYKEFSRGQNCRAGTHVGELEIFLHPDDLAGTPLDGLLTGDRTVRTLAGCDRFRHANEYEDDRLQLFASADYIVGDHVLTFGAEWEEFNVFNLFMQNASGTYTFDNFDQLVNRTPRNSQYRNVPSNDLNEAAANWGYNKWSLFIQDTWAVTPTFQLNYGLRYERFDQSDKPEFSQRMFDELGVRTDNNLDGNDLIMPRVGFLWTPWDRTSISGGFGLFAGGNPQVWVSNSFQQPFVNASTGDLTDADVFNVPQELIDAVAAGQGVPSDFITPGFKTPSDWKASLRFEKGFDLDFGGFSLGDNYRFVAQYLYTRTNQGFLWRVPGQLLPETEPGTAPDGRPIYADLRALGINSLTELSNHSDGESHVFTLSLGKRFYSGVEFDFSYAHQNIEAVTEGTSSQGLSNWRGIFDVDRNNPSARTSLFEVSDAFKLGLGFERAFFGDYATRIHSFTQWTSGSLWSPTFRFNGPENNHLFGRSAADPFNNNPLYVPDPAGDSRVVYASGFDQDGFFDFVDNEGLSTGRIAAPYSKSSRWSSRMDVRLAQEIPGIPGLGRYAGLNRFTLILDIENFWNLLNKKWGTQYGGPGFGQAPIVSADLISAADLAEFGIDDAPALTGDMPRTTCLATGDCVYRFNNFHGQDTSFASAPRSVYQLRLTLRYDF